MRFELEITHRMRTGFGLRFKPESEWVGHLTHTFELEITNRMRTGFGLRFKPESERTEAIDLNNYHFRDSADF